MSRTRWLLLTLLLLVALAGAGGWWWLSRPGPDQQVQRGLEAFERGDWQEADQIASALEEGGDVSHAALLRGTMLYRRARYRLDRGQRPDALPLLSGALDELNRINVDGPVRVEAAAVAGQCLLALGRLSQAEYTLGYVLSENPDHADAHRALAALYWDLGSLPLAVQHSQQVARLDPADGRPHCLIGHIYRDLEQYAEAKAAYREALRRGLSGRHAAEARAGLADVLISLGMFGKAAAVLDELSEEEAAEQFPTALRAECLADRDPRQAREFLDRALERYSRSPRLLLLKAQLLTDAGDYERAAGFLQRAAECAPHDPKPRYQLALTYRRLGRDDKAAEQARRSDRLNELRTEMAELTGEAGSRPWDASVRRRLAEICRELSKPELARMWERAAAACPPPENPAKQ